MASMADVGEMEVGTGFVVRRILFDGPRARCGGCGLGVGDRAELVERNHASVVVRVAGGRLVRCPLDVACFVEVERAGEAGG